MRRDVATLRSRLETYRTLLHRDGSIPELGRLVALLESELAQPGEGRGTERERSANARRGSR